MPHCTSNFAWYLGKFIAGFTGMLFFYVVFLKERDYSCLCRARLREYMRRKGEKRPGRCECKKGPKSMLAAAENVWTWYTGIAEWFQENDPTILSGTVLALGVGLPKNDNDIPSTNCTCCTVLPNQKTKLTESTISIRRKRSRKHCLFRHCSGIVHAEKLMKRKGNKQHCVHLRVSQDLVSDYWKIRDKNGNIVSFDGKRIHEEKLGNTEDDIKVIHKREEETTKEYCYNTLNTNGRFVEKGMNTKDILQRDIKHTEEITSSKLQTDEMDSKETPSADITLKVTYPQNILKSNIFEDVCKNNEKYSPKSVNKDVFEMQKKDSSNKVNKILSNEELPINNINTDVCKCSLKAIENQTLSDTSFDETIVRTECKKCAPAIKKRSSTDYTKNFSRSESKRNLKSNVRDTKNKFNVDYKIVKGLDSRESFTKRTRKYDVKPSMNKHLSTLKSQKKSLGSTYSTVSQKSITNQLKSSCENCSCDTQIRSRNISEWGGAKKGFSSKFNPRSSKLKYGIPSASLQSQKNAYSYSNLKLRKNIDLMFDRNIALAHEIRCTRYKSQLGLSKEKPTLLIYKNRKSGSLRTLDESRYENSTHSTYSSSTISTEFTESSARGNRATAYRYPSYKSSYYTMALNNQHKHNKYNSRIAYSSLLSSSSSLSSSKRPHSWTVLSQDSIYRKREPVSSSSCTNVQRWKRRYSRNGKRTSTYPSSTSSSSSLMSLSTFKEEHDLEVGDIHQTVCSALRKNNSIFNKGTGNIREWRKSQRWGKRPKYREQEKKKMIYANERHVTWDIKRMY